MIVILLQPYLPENWRRLIPTRKLTPTTQVYHSDNELFHICWKVLFAPPFIGGRQTAENVC